MPCMDIFYKFWIIAEVMGTTWTKHYCWYKKEGKVFHMMPYNQVTGKLVRTCIDILFVIKITLKKPSF